MTTAKVNWAGGLRFVGEADSGHLVVMEAPGPDGQDPGASTPVESVLIALCACTGIDVVSVLKKMRLSPSALEVSAEGERAADHPRVFTAIRLRVRATGDVPLDKLERAVRLSEETYCSVGAMLAKTARIEHVCEVVPSLGP